jgi:hypothetical protein
MAKLTRAYITAHQNGVQSYQSFGKRIFAMALEEAKLLVGDGEMDSVSFTLSFEVSPYEPKDCIKICVTGSNGQKWCMKQDVDEMIIEN